MCVEFYDLASVSMIVRSFSNSVRSWSPMFSTIVRRKSALIARRAVHHCAPLQIQGVGKHRRIETTPHTSGGTCHSRVMFLLCLLMRTRRGVSLVQAGTGDRMSSASASRLSRNTRDQQVGCVRVSRGDALRRRITHCRMRQDLACVTDDNRRISCHLAFNTSAIVVQ
jgi:hypothetical protein